MADDFFDDKKEETTETTETPEKIKVGEREFTQEELDRRIGLSDIALEAEEKYNRPISKFWPEYTKQNQELTNLQKENEQLKQTRFTPQTTIDPTDEEKVASQVKETLGKYGYAPMKDVEERARAIASEVVSGYKMLEDVNKVVAKEAADGNPQISSEDLLAYMQEKNNNDPEFSYKMKFEKELDSIKEKKLAGIKGTPLVTDAVSTAGAKVPNKIKVTRDNFQQVLNEYMQ